MNVLTNKKKSVEDGGQLVNQEIQRIDEEEGSCEEDELVPV